MPKKEGFGLAQKPRVVVDAANPALQEVQLLVETTILSPYCSNNLTLSRGSIIL